MRRLDSWRICASSLAIAASLRIAALLVLTCLLSSTAQATNFSWNGIGSQFNSASSWTQSGLPVDPDGIPDSSDIVTFDRGNVPQYSVFFGNVLIPSSAIHPTVDKVVIGNNPLSFVGLWGSTLTVDSTNITETARGIVIGSGAGDVAALTSTLATFDTQYATLGSAAASSGTLNLTSSSAGAFSVSGTGATYDLIVGLNGTGTINVTNGRDVTVADDIVLGLNATGVGIINLSGVGSTLNGMPQQFEYADLTVGGFGRGTVQIASGASVNVSRTYIADGVGSVGQLSVDGIASRATSFTSGLVEVGTRGHGTFSASNGGDVSSSFVSIAENPGSLGEVTISGSGSIWKNSTGQLGLGYLYVGRAGSGTLNITGGGDLTNNILSGGIDACGGLQGTCIGLEANSTGEVNVDGSGSTWTNTGDLILGRSGEGRLNITNGGQVVVRLNPSFDDQAIMGFATGSMGRLTIDGVGSQLTIEDTADPNQGDLYVGRQGAAVVTVTNGGRLSSDNVVIERGVLVQGNGVVAADTENRGGTVAPGTSIGTLTIDGHYMQRAAGTLEIEMASATSFDRLAVTGNIEMGGKLEVSLAGGYFPNAPQSFNIIDWGGLRFGTFSSIGLPTMGGLLSWDTSQLYSGGILNVAPVLPGDYNHNGIVDAADYVVWRKTDGSPAGYNLWRTNFGRTAGSGAAAIMNTAVPEPANLLLLLMGMLAIAHATVRQFHKLIR